MEKNCVAEILSLLGKIDVMLEMTEDLSATFDTVSTTNEFLQLVGSPTVFATMKNVSLLKSILHNMSAQMMDVSRAQAIKYSDSDNALSPTATKLVSDFVKMEKETKSEEPTEEQKEEAPEEKTLKEEPVVEKPPERKEKSQEEINKIKNEKARRRRQQETNKQIGNVLEYFKEKFEEVDDDE